MKSHPLNTLIFTIIMLSVLLVKAQEKDEHIRLEVLRKNIIGKEFVFGKWNDNGGTETSLTYLGTLKSNNGKTYKIMNYVWTWGMSCRATRRILIFNHKNQYLGNYYAPTGSSLPKEIKDGILVFANKDRECDKKIISKISFKNGLPKEIYVACNTDFGDNLVFDGTI